MKSITLDRIKNAIAVANVAGTRLVLEVDEAEFLLSTISQLEQQIQDLNAASGRSGFLLVLGAIIDNNIAPQNGELRIPTRYIESIPGHYEISIKNDPRTQEEVITLKKPGRK